MTLIATTLNHKVPIIISDLLWTTEEKITPISLPTNRSVDYSSHIESSDATPARLAQKSYIINDKICISFAGDMDQIQVFLLVFKDYFQNKQLLQSSDIHNFLEQYPFSSAYPDSSLLISYFTLDNEGGLTAQQFHVPGDVNTVDAKNFQLVEGWWNVLAEQLYERSMACGSGTGGFLNIINQPAVFKSNFDNGDFRKALQLNAVLIAKMLTLEKVSLYTIKKAWGGGFELCYFDGKRFQKFEKVAYVISEANFDENGKLSMPFPRLIMYYHYRNDILYITVLEVERYAVEETELEYICQSFNGEFKQSLFEIEGIDIDDITQFELPTDLSFSTDCITMGYSLITPEKSIFNPAFFNYGPEVTIEYKQNNYIKLTIYKQIVGDVITLSEEQYHLSQTKNQ